MPNTKRVIRRRINLLAADPHCYYCGTGVRYYPLAEGEVIPDDFATIEHVYTLNDGPRPPRGEQVLACYRCNQDKGVADQARAERERKLRQQHLTYRIGEVLREAG